MALSLAAYKILNSDKLRTGFRAKYNLLLDKVIKEVSVDAEGVMTFYTHDNTELTCDLTDGFYTKEEINDLYLLSYATEEDAGKIRIATKEEVIEGADDMTVVTPYKLQLALFYANGRSMIAGEDLLAGDMIYIYISNIADIELEDYEPEYAVKKAIATSFETLCDGFVEIEALEGEDVFVRLSGSINTYTRAIDPDTEGESDPENIIPLTTHKRYYLSPLEAGKVTLTPPINSGEIKQLIGYAIGTNELMLELDWAKKNFGPVFEDFPVLYFIVGIEATREVLLSDYLSEYNVDDEGYSYRFIGEPDWVTEHTVVFDNMSITGTPEEVGTVYFDLEVTNENGDIALQNIKIVVLEEPSFKHTLLDISETTVSKGTIPSAFEVSENKSDIQSVISNNHDKIYWKVNKGSDASSNILVQDTQEVDETADATYRAFLIENGVDMPVGLYRHEFAIFIQEVELYRDVNFFTIYDEEYLLSSVFQLWNYGDDVAIGDIQINGSTQFIKPDAWDVKNTITDFEHDKVVLKLSLDGVEIKSVLYTIGVPRLNGEYFVYDAVESDQASGDYVIRAEIYLAGILLSERQSNFSILTKDPEPEGGLILVEMIPNTANYNELGVLGLAESTYDLPEGGFNVLCPSFDNQLDYLQIEYFNTVSNSYVLFDTKKYTKKEEFVVYLQPIQDVNVLAFRNLSSIQIGSIHIAPSRHRFRFTAKLGGSSGEIVGIKQADVSFRVPVDPADLTGLQLWVYSDGVKNIVDSDLPITGRTLSLPTFPDDWTIAFLKTKNNDLFDMVEVRLRKDSVSIYNSLPDLVMIYTSPTAIREVPSSSAAYIYGFNNAEGLRYLYSASGDKIIDEEGIYEATFTVKLGGTIIETLTTTIEIITPLEETPEKDCCELNETQIFNFTSATSVVCNHKLDGYPEIDIIIGGQRWGSVVTYNTPNTLTVTFKRPKTGFIRI